MFLKGVISKTAFITIIATVDNNISFAIPTAVPMIIRLMLMLMFEEFFKRVKTGLVVEVDMDWIEFVGS